MCSFVVVGKTEQTHKFKLMENLPPAKLLRVYILITGCFIVWIVDIPFFHVLLDNLGTVGMFWGLVM